MKRKLIVEIEVSNSDISESLLQYKIDELVTDLEEQCEQIIYYTEKCIYVEYDEPSAVDVSIDVYQYVPLVASG